MALDLTNRVGHYVRLLSRRKPDDEQVARVTTYFTRTDDRFVGLANRTMLARQNGAKMFVSIHLNSFLLKSANGVEVCVPVGAPPSLTGQNDRLAADICYRLAACGFRNRGVKPRPKLAVLNGFKSGGPTVLIEAGFLSNDHDRRLILDAGSRECIAIEIGAAIVQACGVEPRMELVV